MYLYSRKFSMGANFRNFGRSASVKITMGKKWTEVEIYQSLCYNYLSVYTLIWMSAHVVLCSLSALEMATVKQNQPGTIQDANEAIAGAPKLSKSRSVALTCCLTNQFLAHGNSPDITMTCTQAEDTAVVALTCFFPSSFFWVTSLIFGCGSCLVWLWSKCRTFVLQK